MEITKIIFNYTGSPGEKIPQKVLGGLLFFDSHCIYHYLVTCTYTQNSTVQSSVNMASNHLLLKQNYYVIF